MLCFPNAKINLGLNIVSRREDGYHNLETIFYPIPLKDALEITINKNPLDKNIRLSTYGNIIEGCPNDNLVVKAYELLSKFYSLPKVSISLYKNIPSGAGLGGGSSDAAFALKLLNKISELDLSNDELKRYATTLGADCSFFINNKPSLATGIGNVLSEIDLSLEGYYLILVKPNIHISTKEAYSLITPQSPQISISEIITKPIDDWKHYLINDFEKSIFNFHPQLNSIKSTLYSMGALYASMSGSGSTIFGIFSTPQNIDILNELYGNCFYFHEKLNNL